MELESGFKHWIKRAAELDFIGETLNINKFKRK
jgi:hypothetical protein